MSDDFVTIQLGKEDWLKEITSKLKSMKAEEYIFNPTLYKISESNNYYTYFSSFLTQINIFKKQLIDGKTYENDKILRDKLIEDNVLVPSNFDADSIYPKKDDYFGLYINLSLDCTSNCVFCYAKNPDCNQKVKFEFIEELIGYIRDKNYKKMYVVFAGGEPTLHFDYIKKITHYLNKLEFENVPYQLISNGTMSREQFDWFADNNFEIKISVDGPPKIQRRNNRMIGDDERFRKFEDKLKYFNSKKEGLVVGSVITEESIPDISEIAYYFYKLGINKFQLAPFLDVVGEGKLFDYDKFFEYALPIKEISDEFGMNVSVFDLNIDRTHKQRCIGGFYLLPNGTLSACSMAIYPNERNKELYFGKFKDGKLDVDEEKYKKIQEIRAHISDDCESCFIRWNCANRCPAYRIHETGDIRESNKERCILNRKTIKKFIDYQVNKSFGKIKPHFSIDNNKAYYSMFFQDIELNQKDKTQNLFSLIPEKQILDKCKEKIILTQKKAGDVPVFFMINFVLFDSFLDSGSRDNIISFLNALDKEKIWYKLTKPLPLCVVNHNEILENMHVPKNMFESLDLFYVIDDKVHISGTNTGRKISSYDRREEIFQEFLENPDNKGEAFSKCRFCPPRLKNKCTYSKFLYQNNNISNLKYGIDLKYLYDFFKIIDTSTTFRNFSDELLRIYKPLSQEKITQQKVQEMYDLKSDEKIKLFKELQFLINEIVLNKKESFQKILDYTKKEQQEPIINIIVNPLNSGTNAFYDPNKGIFINLFYYAELMKTKSKSEVKEDLRNALIHELAHYVYYLNHEFNKEPSVKEIMKSEGFAFTFESKPKIYFKIREQKDNLMKYVDEIEKNGYEKDILERLLKEPIIKEFLGPSYDSVEKSNTLEAFSRILVKNRGILYYLGAMQLEKPKKV